MDYEGWPSWSQVDVDDYSLHKLRQYGTTHVQRVARKLSITRLKVHFCGVQMSGMAKLRSAILIWTPNIQFTLDLYTLICVSPSNDKPIKDVSCSSSSSSRSLAQRQLQEQQHQASSVAAQQQLQIGSISRWPYRVPAHYPRQPPLGSSRSRHSLTWYDIFLVCWRDANQVLDLAYHLLKSK